MDCLEIIIMEVLVILGMQMVRIHVLKKFLLKRKLFSTSSVGVLFQVWFDLGLHC